MFVALDDWIPSGEARKCWLVVLGDLPALIYGPWLALASVER
jgi:hypothetical protein